MDKKSRELVMAKLYFKNKDYKMAEKSFNEYLNMNPEDVTALKLLAQVYEQNKRYDKAFEMYERCYLAAPERTGILLDICRILLMNEIWLENVDYRKWLNLAIKAFPSNPIVVNYKAFLSTLPLDDQKPNSHPDTNQIKSPVTSGDDTLKKILDKLSSLSDRVERIEKKLDKLSVIENKMSQLSIVEPVDKPTTNNVHPQPEQRLETPIKPTNTSLFSPSMEKSNSPFQASTTAWSLGQTTPSKVVFEKSEKENSVKEEALKAPTTSLFGGLNLDKSNTSSQGLWSFGQTESKVEKTGDRSSTKEPEPMPATNLFAASMAKFDIPGAWTFGQANDSKGEKKERENNAKEDGPVNTLTTNLFAASIAKHDVPWTFGQSAESKIEKNEEENNAEESEEVVPNEELPIENTCDMQPIEIKTGEEEEDVLFEHRCKLFRFRDKEYKERGLGTIKVLKHKTTGAGRLIMRREAVGLVCLNCWGLSKVEKVKETQIRFAGIDASDGEPAPTTFVVRFKTPELTEKFLEHVSQLSQNNTSINSP